MELSGEEGEMALPINTTYGGHGHLNHIVPSPAPPPPPPHHHQTPITNGPTMPPPPLATLEDNAAYKTKVVRYRECLKNHAAAMGGSATDGCGEFMPCGEEGTLEALTCSACNCHRNFHRKEIEGEPHHHHLPIIPTPYDCNYHAAPPHLRLGNGRKLILQGHHPKGSLGNESFGALVPARTPQPLLMSYNMGIGSLPSDQSDEQEDGGGYMSRHPPPPYPPPHHLHHHHQMVKKRFRTKFTQEQKEKMLSFAEKVGWKIQKQEESVVQHFCQEVGIKRRVLKVWMHNNKHTLAKKINPIPTNPQPQIN